jgi:mannosidase alpha-like ER degradation enhancer 1
VLTFETGAAGAGTLLLEFGTLSRLTGDEQFEKAAKRVGHFPILETSHI